MTSSQQVAQIPYGIAELQAGLLYVEGTDRRLECLDLASGEVLARTEFPAKALAVSEAHIIGWSPGIPQPNTLMVFKAQRRGDTLSPIWQRTIELPMWVDTRSPEPGGFALIADVGHEVVITWEAHSRYSGGAPPPAQVEIAYAHDDSRLVRIDPESGEVIGEEPVELTKGHEEESGLALPLVPYRWGSLWVNRPWSIGQREALLLRPSNSLGILLRHRNPSGTAPGTDILLTTDATTEPAVTLDGSLILAHERDLAPSEWKVFSAATGERIGSLPYETGTEGAAPIGDRILYVVAEAQQEPPVHRRLLRCRDLASQALVWSHVLSETPIRRAPPLPP